MFKAKWILTSSITHKCTISNIQFTVFIGYFPDFSPWYLIIFNMRHMHLENSVSERHRDVSHLFFSTFLYHFFPIHCFIFTHAWSCISFFSPPKCCALNLKQFFTNRIFASFPCFCLLCPSLVYLVKRWCCNIQPRTSARCTALGVHSKMLIYNACPWEAFDELKLRRIKEQ